MSKKRKTEAEAPPSGGFLQAAWQALNSFSSSEWISSPPRLFLLLCVAGFLAILLLALLSPPVSWEYGAEEAPLSKLSQVQLRAGEEYVYAIKSGGVEGNARVIAALSRGCPGLALYDAAVPQPDGMPRHVVCIGRDGIGLSPDGKKTGTNFSYLNASWPYFSPWMLAATDGWDWRANSTVSIPSIGATSRQAMHWKVLSRTTFKGRDGWLVSFSLVARNSSETESSRMIIDSEKRILLWSNSSLAEIGLASAPFELDG